MALLTCRRTRSRAPSLHAACGALLVGAAALGLAVLSSAVPADARRSRDRDATPTQLRPTIANDSSSAALAPARPKPVDEPWAVPRSRDTTDECMRAVPPAQWTGMRFVVLGTSPAYRKFGYELYPTAALDKEVAPIDARTQLANRRLRYEVLAGTTLRVIGVTRPDSEYVIAFTGETSGITAYGRSHKAAIKGIAPLEDLDKALLRWKGKTLYAAKRQVNTYDSLSGAMGSIRLNTETPLVVTGICWGKPPLPPQPLWVLVKTPDGRPGFIPTPVSWTNVMSDAVRAFRPWNEFVLEENPVSRYSLKPEALKLINAHQLARGMRRVEAWLSWGYPMAQDSGALGPAMLERWVYPAQYVYFSGDTLAGTENR
jgi:hypothetical protein